MRGGEWALFFFFGWVCGDDPAMIANGSFLETRLLLVCPWALFKVAGPGMCKEGLCMCRGSSFVLCAGVLLPCLSFFVSATDCHRLYATVTVLCAVCGRIYVCEESLDDRHEIKVLCCCAKQPLPARNYTVVVVPERCEQERTCAMVACFFCFV